MPETQQVEIDETGSCMSCGADTLFRAAEDPQTLLCSECQAAAEVQPAAAAPAPDAISLPPAEADTAELPTAPTLQQPTHVRVGGGQAGLRVQHFGGGVTTHKRVSAIDPPSNDHTLVPKEILSEAKRLLEQGTSPAVVVMNVRELLDPWL